MKVLITGGSGFIGSNLIRFLLSNEETIEVLNIDLLTYAGHESSNSNFADCGRYRHAKIDISNAADIANALNEFKPDAVMHLAAESHVDRSITGPGAFITTNIIGTYTMLEESRKYLDRSSYEKKRRFRFLHVSTDEVYGSLDDDGLFTEDTSYDPRSPYSASKASSDHLARAWHHTYGLPTIITNCSNNYGPYQFPEKLIPVVILKALAQKPIPVYGKGLNVRDWLFVEDHASAMHKALTQGTPGQTYNVGGNNELKNIDVVQTICSILDELKPSKSNYAELISYVEDRPGHDFRYAIDATKIRKELNWRPSHDFRSGIRKTIKWYLENQRWCQTVLAENNTLDRIGLLQSSSSAEPAQ